MVSGAALHLCPQAEEQLQTSLPGNEHGGGLSPRKPGGQGRKRLAGHPDFYLNDSFLDPSSLSQIFKAKKRIISFIIDNSISKNKIIGNKFN